VLGLVLVACLAAEPDAPGASSGEPKDITTAIVKALLGGDVETLTGFCPAGFSFDGRPAWSPAEIRQEWIRALQRRSLAGVQLAGVEVVDDGEMVKRYGNPPARWSRFNFTGTKIGIADLDGTALLIVFRRRGASWIPVGVGE
jgi:hypothetical protein